MDKEFTTVARALTDGAQEREDCMNTLLHIDSSATPRGSVSRKLTAEFAAAWRASRTGEKVIYRDLDKSPVPAVDHNLIAALAAAPGMLLNDDQRRALSLSNHLVDELFEADAYVLGVPMVNFSVPGAFKSYMDQLPRMGRTLIAGPQGVEGALGSKKVLVIATSKGGFGNQGPHAGWDFHQPLLQKYFESLGVKDFAYVPVIQNPLQAAPEVLAIELEKARASLREVLARWNAEAAQVAAHTVHEVLHKAAA
jgi:FMN-dependent NADH-azoreductase